MNDDLLDIVKQMYTNEPCRICGKMMTKKDLETAVWAGYSESCEARTAHLECWNACGDDTSKWAYK